MKVKFRQAFFGPNSTRYRPGVEYDVPDTWMNKLPAGAKVLDETSVEEKKALASAAAGSATKGTKS